jgi:hypothetical protein
MRLRINFFYKSHFSSVLIIFAGFPAITKKPSGKLLVTTDPAPPTIPSPK